LTLWTQGKHEPEGLILKPHGNNIKPKGLIL